ncbi:MAG: DUF4249 domain-containing protein [Cytophagales bacterium]|nr:DUF4249 domain-containing protein [Cytophagales bacterium]
MRRALFFFIILGSCIDPYQPPELSSSAPFLIVDGFINTSGTSKLTLSWSQNVLDINTPNFETQATVWIEDEQGVVLNLISDSQGNYILPSQPLPSTNYRLMILTSTSRQFQSDFVPVLQTPPIDSVTWHLTDDLGVAFTVSTHDDLTPEGLYKWTFEETWEYRSAFGASVEFDPNTKVVKPRIENIYQCWRTEGNKDILVESTTRFKENKVSKFKLATFLQNSEKAKYKYSTLVKQQAISKEAFNYWKQVRQTTENIGTLFGPVPYKVEGNIHSSSNPNEFAVGYFSISSVSTQRASVSFNQLPTPIQYVTHYKDCEAFEISLELVNFFTGPYLLIDPILVGNGPAISGYRYGSLFCVDCRHVGGTTTKPDFW